MDRRDREGQRRTVAMFAGVMASLLTATISVAQEEVVERFDDGGVQRRYRVDADGRRHGVFEEFDFDGILVLRARYARGELSGPFETYWPSGEPRLRASYRGGVLQGAFREFDEDNAARFFEGRYRDGLLHGAAKMRDGRKLVSKQKWNHGQIVRLDGVKTFAHNAPELRASLAAILRADEAGADQAATPEAAFEAERSAALRRLMAFRYLCLVPHEGMSLAPEWNALCDDASEVCRRNGEIDHFPPEPPDIDPGLYRRGALGARSSNLSLGHDDMASTVDGYMDDSDPSNIDRVGHRRWCINPAMRKTGFGRSGRCGAMWAFDQSGRAPSGLEVVAYPPPGYVPVDFFGSRHAWSFAMIRGGSPKQDQMEIRVYELDDRYVRTGEPLTIDHVSIGKAGQGTGPCVIFRPVGVVVAPGRKYFVDLDLDGDGEPEVEQVVEFCASVKSLRSTVEAGWKKSRGAGAVR